MIGATATAALSMRIATLLGGGHPNHDHQHQPPPRLRPPTPSLDLMIDGQAVLLPILINTDDPHAGAIPQLLAPLCLWLRGLVAASPQGQRVLVGVVGAAGAGKSYLCALLAAVLCRLADCEEEAAMQEGATADGWRAVTLSMDAYHLPNAELEARGIKHLKGMRARLALFPTSNRVPTIPHTHRRPRDAGRGRAAARLDAAEGDWGAGRGAAHLRPVWIGSCGTARLIFTATFM